MLSQIFVPIYRKLYLIVEKIYESFFILYFFSVFLLLISIHAIPTFDTTNNQPDQEEASTTFKQIFEHTTVEDLLQNKTASIINLSSVPIITTPITDILNSTATILTVSRGGVNGKLVSYNTTTNYYYYDTTTPSSGISTGAVVGIIIAVIILLCCCGLCGFCKKSGHWENAKVWVND